MSKELSDDDRLFLHTQNARGNVRSIFTFVETAVPLRCRYCPHRCIDYGLHPSVEPAASFQALMRTGGWLRGIAHTLETADQRRAMRSAADRSVGRSVGRLHAAQVTLHRGAQEDAYRRGAAASGAAKSRGAR